MSPVQGLVVQLQAGVPPDAVQVIEPNASTGIGEPGGLVAETKL
jgi:hypothetical protein